MALITGALLLLVSGAALSAHHSFAAEFDANQPVQLRGTVVKVEWINPHTWIHLDVKKADGSTERWMIEGGTPNTLLRQGLTKEALPQGTELVVDGYKAKNGTQPRQRARPHPRRRPQDVHGFVRHRRATRRKGCRREVERARDAGRAASPRSCAGRAQTSALVAQSRVTFDQAAPVFTALPSNLPAGLRGLSTEEIARQWPSWVERHDREVRARLARGDDDSLVNFWLYGTSFTTHAPAIARASPLSASALDDIVKGRLNDLLDGVTTPRGNERLQFGHRVLAAHNADPRQAGGRERARALLLDARQRMIREFADTDRTLAAAKAGGAAGLTAANATIFRDRGLSSDTSILADYSVHVALETIARMGTLAPGSVRRVAVVGPGLDFTNKTDGYDYYPEQTIQPFALMNSLRRLKLAAADLQVTTFDISARVNEHLKNAVSRAASPSGYVVTLPLDGDESWTGALLAYWEQWGDTIGEEVTGIRPPATAGAVKTRAVRIQPAAVSSIAPRDLNLVIDRLPVRDDERFDLIVATNVLVYYDIFEQALGASNLAAMLRPGGVFVTNTAVLPTPPLRASAAYLRVAHTTARYDEMFWYQREDR